MQEGERKLVRDWGFATDLLTKTSEGFGIESSVGSAACSNFVCKGPSLSKVRPEVIQATL
jgi:hypothetical protein